MNQRSGAAPVRFDPLLLAAVLALVALGLVMVYSSSAITAQDKLGDGLYFLKRQILAAGLGLVAMANTVLPLGGADWVDLDTQFLLTEDRFEGGWVTDRDLIRLTTGPGLDVRLARG